MSQTNSTCELERLLNKHVAMKMVPSSLSARTLISSINAPEPDPAATAREENDSPFALKGSRIFSRNGRAIFIGIISGIALLVTAGFVYDRYQRGHGERPLFFTKFIRATTHTVSASPHELVRPAPLVVLIDEKLLHVSAISLGHPRLAVINGQSVAQGDWVKARLANPAVTVLLRVMKIGDGRIDLTDGTQVITTRLLLPELDRTKAN